MHGMDYLKSRLSVIDQYIKPGSRILYIDYPLHFNVGDLLILKGTEAFFADRRYDVTRRYSYFGFPWHERNFPVVPKDVTIVLHGGGNFGDIYYPHQLLREKIINHYRDHRIVIFPQTMHFSEPARMRQAAEVMSRHKDLHFLARDQRTYDVFRREFSNNTELCPDMAHFLWGQLPRKAPGATGGGTLWMMRRDEETVAVPEMFRGQIDQPLDWSDFTTRQDRMVNLLTRRTDQVNGVTGRKLVPVERFWYGYTDRMVARSIDRILAYDRIVTSRMHGHILACLLGMKTVLLDNSYGKNSTYFEAWTNRVDDCELFAA
jgi:pyruvyl transferase EpsO